MRLSLSDISFRVGPFELCLQILDKDGSGKHTFSLQQGLNDHSGKFYSTEVIFTAFHFLHNLCMVPISLTVTLH